MAKYIVCARIHVDRYMEVDADSPEKAEEIATMHWEKKEEQTPVIVSIIEIDSQEK